MADPLLRVSGLTKSFGGVVANREVDLDVATGEVHAVIGPNGAGKTTLIAQLAGELKPASGEIAFTGMDITHLGPPARSRLGIARSFQITSLFPEMTALQNVALAVQGRGAHSFRFWRPADEDNALNGPAADILVRMGLADRAGAKAGSLAHGEQRQLEIAMALATEPKLLLLDEPMAGIGRGGTERLIELLAGLKGGVTMVLVEHDMDAVFALADRITVLNEGMPIASGAPAAIRGDPNVRLAYLGDQA